MYKSNTLKGGTRIVMTSGPRVTAPGQRIVTLSNGQKVITVQNASSGQHKFNGPPVSLLLVLLFQMFK